MSSRLDRITNWEEQARLAHYRAAEMAKLIQVSDRHLRRYFHDAVGMAPQEWMDELRAVDAHRFLVAGDSIKEVTFKLGFRQPSHFCAVIKKRFGVTPRDLAQVTDFDMSAMHNKCPWLITAISSQRSV